MKFLSAVPLILSAGSGFVQPSRLQQLEKPMFYDYDTSQANSTYVLKYDKNLYEEGKEFIFSYYFSPVFNDDGSFARFIRTRESDKSFFKIELFDFGDDIHHDFNIYVNSDYATYFQVSCRYQFAGVDYLNSINDHEGQVERGDPYDLVFTIHDKTSLFSHYQFPTFSFEYLRIYYTQEYVSYIGYLKNFSAGYEEGYDKGYKDGLAMNPSVDSGVNNVVGKTAGFVATILSGFGAFFAIEIVPGLSFGIIFVGLFLVALIGILIRFVVHFKKD